jgi:hypothetical protein
MGIVLGIQGEVQNVIYFKKYLLTSNSFFNTLWRCVCRAHGFEKVSLEAYYDEKLRNRNWCR